MSCSTLPCRFASGERMKASLTSTEMLKVLMSPSVCSRAMSLAVMKSWMSGWVIDMVAMPAPRRVPPCRIARSVLANT